MSNAARDGPRDEARPRRRRRLLFGSLAAVVLLLAIGLVWYWADWTGARADRRDQSSEDYLKARLTFLEHVNANRLDTAYQSTAASFQKRVSREVFAERARRYLDFKQKPGTRDVEGHASGPIGGDYRGPNQMTVTDTLEDSEGGGLRVSITVAHEDSILYRRPPPPRVAEFTVDEVPPKTPRNPRPPDSRRGR